MRSRDPAAVRAALAPVPGEPRLPRIARLAAIALIDAGRPVTRATLAAISASVDTERRAKPGFSEASLRTNHALRAVYEFARDHAPAKSLRRSGHVGAHILRETKERIATALVVGRMAAEEREEEHRLAVCRLGEAFAAPDVDLLRAVRAALPANALTGAAKGAALARKEDAARNAAAVGRATEWAGKHGIRATARWLAERCGVHPGTVERLAMRAAGTAANAVTFDFEVTLPPALMRHAKWDLGRALQVERDYIRALHAATMSIATSVIDREHQAHRAAVREGRPDDAAR